MTVGLIEDQAGLTAAVMSAILFTAYLVITLMTRENPAEPAKADEA